MALKAPPKHDKHEKTQAPKAAPADDGLPTEDTDQVVSMNSLRWLFVSPPGFGKTELFSLFPDSLMLACEEGHKFVRGRKLIIDEWDGTGESTDADGNVHVSFREAVRRICNSERYQFVFIDTLDALAKKCIDWHVTAANQQHLSDLGDYGKGFDLGQNDPIRRSLNEIFSTGRGLGLITHQEIKTNTFKKGTQPRAKKETSLPNGIFKIVYPQMDVIIHGEFGGVREGQEHRDRIIKSEGDEEILAKNRGGVLPPAWISPLEKSARIEQMKGFFDPDEKKRAANIQKAYAEFAEHYQD